MVVTLVPLTLRRMSPSSMPLAAASLLRFFRGRHIVLINRDATPLDNQADLVLHERVGEVCRHLRPTPLEVGE